MTNKQALTALFNEANRLSIEEPKYTTHDLWQMCRQIERGLEKSGALKDIEKEYDIDLVTLFNVLKNGGWFIDYRDKHIFYAKATLVSKLDGKFECSQEDLKFNGFIILEQLYGLGYELKDCGKTWALTREELENEK